MSWPGNAWPFITGGGVPATPLDILDTRLHFWGEPRLNHKTLNGDLISRLDDESTFGYHLTQGDAGLQPTWNASGGPNDHAFISLPRLTDQVINTAISLSAGRRLLSHVVVRLDTALAQVYPWFLESGSGFFDPTHGMERFGITNIRHKAKTGSVDVATDGGWHSWAAWFLASGRESRKDGVITSPNFSGNAAAEAVEAISVGYTFGGASGGDNALMIVGEDVTADEYAAILEYSQFWFGV